MAFQSVLYFAKLHEYAKENSGPMNPGVESVEGTVKIVVGPVYEKFHDVPIDFLKFVDQKEQQSDEKNDLKYLEIVQVTAFQSVLYFAKLYEYAKENSGPMKPGVESVEGTAKKVVGPVYEKFHDVPIDFLKLVDQKVEDAFLLALAQSRRPNLVRQSGLDDAIKLFGSCLIVEIERYNINQENGHNMLPRISAGPTSTIEAV